MYLAPIKYNDDENCYVYINMAVDDRMDICEASQIFFKCYYNNSETQDILAKKYCAEDTQKPREGM